MKLIILRGQRDAGKTTTCGMIYSDLLSKTTEAHQYNGIKQTGDARRYHDNGALVDFTAVITVAKLKIGIISAGDDDDPLKLAIEVMIIAKVDVLICCTRTHKRKGSSYLMIEKDYSKTYDTLGVVNLPYSEEKNGKEKNVNAAFNRLIELVSREIG